MKKEISFDERKKIQLEMLDEIDKFCQENNITYMLDSGTMIGAVRHHGFIPWDDDVDIAMPKNDLLRFKDTFQSENLKFCDVYTTKLYDHSQTRITDTRTYSINRFGDIQYGICIDLHVIVGLPNDTSKIDRFLSIGRMLRKIRINARELQQRLVKYFHIKQDYIYATIVKVARRHVFCLPGESDKYYFVHCGPYKWNYVFDFNPAEKVIYVNYEDRKYPIPERYDEFLTHKYGNYMELPPVEKQKPYHGKHYFFKD